MSTTRIVVGVDGSEGAARALEWCLQEGKGRDDVAVLVVHALSLTAELVVALPPFDSEQWRAGVMQELERWCAPLREGGVRYRAMVIEDHPARALMRAAQEHDAEMIVVGAHGHGGFTDFLAGGVPIKLVHHARKPVLIVPPERP